jgi:hypothetical protein
MNALARILRRARWSGGHAAGGRHLHDRSRRERRGDAARKAGGQCHDRNESGHLKAPVTSRSGQLIRAEWSRNGRSPRRRRRSSCTRGCIRIPAQKNPATIIESDHLATPPSAHLVGGPRLAPLRVFPERWRAHDCFAGISAFDVTSSQLIGKAILFVDFEGAAAGFLTSSEPLQTTCHLRNTRRKTRLEPCDSEVFSLCVQVA